MADSHVPFLHRSQNKVLAIRPCSSALFFNLLYTIRIITSLAVGGECHVR